ncbi:hypothetical protein [Endozoicomonas sp. 2B-B]
MSAWFHGVYDYLVRRTKRVKSCNSIGVACKFSSGNFYALQSVQQVQVLLKLLCNNQHCPRRQGCRANKYRQRDGSLCLPPLLQALYAQHRNPPDTSEVDRLLVWMRDQDSHTQAFCFDVMMSAAYIDATSGLERHLEFCENISATGYNAHLGFIN